MPEQIDGNHAARELRRRAVLSRARCAGRSALLLVIFGTCGWYSIQAASFSACQAGIYRLRHSSLLPPIPSFRSEIIFRLVAKRSVRASQTWAGRVVCFSSPSNNPRSSRARAGDAGPAKQQGMCGNFVAAGYPPYRQPTLVGIHAARIHEWKLRRPTQFWPFYVFRPSASSSSRKCAFWPLRSSHDAVALPSFH